VSFAPIPDGTLRERGSLTPEFLRFAEKVGKDAHFENLNWW